MNVIQRKPIPLEAFRSKNFIGFQLHTTWGQRRDASECVDGRASATLSFVIERGEMTNGTGCGTVNDKDMNIIHSLRVFFRRVIDYVLECLLCAFLDV